ncbi:MAG TPA: metal-dependent hydrolase [Terriglobales bacterium]|nr:metal-dependent hydrolase [Terriglobales bacterium]
MEPITHFLTGACLGRAGFNRQTALATATMTLAAEAPDLDVLWGFKGPVYGFAHHRGFTHSFLGVFLVSAVVTGFMYLIWRLRGRKTNLPDLPPRWGRLYLLAYIAGLSHILLDFTNNYGVRPFWPFWEKWYSWDIVFIVEPALYIFLLAGLALPALLSRHTPSPRGRRSATLALICVVALYAIRDYEHRHAVRALHAISFQNGDTQDAPLRVSVYPYAWSVTHWYAVAETTDFFASADMNSRTGELDRKGLEFFAKAPETPATLTAKSSYLGRVYLDWARYPLVTETDGGDKSAVHFMDLRFDYPRYRGQIVLSCTIEVDRNLRLVREAFGLREQKPPL